MQLSLFTYNATAINDGTNFEAYFPQDTPVMPRVSIEWVKRNKAFPKLASKNFDGPTITIGIICKGTFHTQLLTLEKLFAEDDFVFHRLIAKDKADSDRQWYLSGYAAGPITPDSGVPGSYFVTLAVEEPFWRVVTPSSVSPDWSVTATGQTKALTVLGNKQARPIITVTPTLARNHGYAYQRFIAVYNPGDLPMPNYKVDLTGGGINTATLVADATVSNQVNKVGGILAGDTSIPIDTPVGGGLGTAGEGWVDTEQIRWTGNAAGSLNPVERGINGTTAAVHADNAVIKRSKMAADGSDFIALLNGKPANLWFNGLNTATTQAWINLTLKPRVELTLGLAISNVGTPSTITFASTSDNQAAIKKLPASGTLLIESELWTYSALNKTTLTATVTKRALYGTAAAAHALGVTVRWIEHVIWLMYGNYEATAPTTNNNLMPIFDLNSTMISRVFSTFRDADTLRGGWSPALVRSLGNNSDFYTGSHEADADPATEMGATIQAFEAANVWKADTAEITWQLYDPAGFTTITVTGAKYRQTANWPATVACEVSNDGVKWTRVFNEASPTSSVTWTALASHAGVSLGGTYKYVRFRVLGSVAGISGNKASWEAQGVTLVLPAASVPQIIVGAEIANRYYISSRITNNTNNEYIDIACPIGLNDTLTINCDAMTAKFDNGHNAYPYLTISHIASEEWLPLEPGVTNTLKLDEVGVSGETIAVSWEDRNTL